MYLEVNVRWNINQDDEEEAFVYSEMTLDVKDVRAFNKIHNDEDHTIIRTYQEENYCINIPYNVFKKVFVELSGKNIHSIKTQLIEKKEEDNDDKKDDLFLE